MQIFAQAGLLHTINVSDETTVGDLKVLLSQAEGLAVGDQVVAFGGVPLENESTLCSQVPELGTVTVSPRLLGGVCECTSYAFIIT